ncbi:MAG TPA: hypothetical protein VGS10_17485 [Terracidiphilus sp.]|nr:hypothetical protein [Terracidiphilus sp.]
MDIPKYSVWMGRAQILRKGWPATFILLLDKINGEIADYEKAFSPMAKRNIALALQERIADFEKAWKKAYAIVPLPQAIVELRAAALEHSAGVSISSHKYDFVSCIGYKVGTGKFDQHMFTAQWDGSKYEYGGIVNYSGEVTDHADCALRLSRMKNAINQAYNLYRFDHGKNKSDDKTLKIFMAPEFFFRGINGAYDVAMVSEIFTDLQGYTKDAKFKDWLFVFGTVIAASFDDRLVCRKCGKSGARQFQRIGVGRYSCTTAGCPAGSVTERRLGARIDNIALIQKGGEASDRNSYLVEKEYVSHIDFQRHVTKAHLKEGNMATGHSNVAILKDWDVDRRIHLAGEVVRALPVPGSRDTGGGAPSKFTNERMGGSIFTIDGIKFGLEICLDHLNNRIPSGAGVQIQLVPSAGAFLQQFACVSGGIAFNVDGGGQGSCDLRIHNSGAKPESSGTLSKSSSGVPGGGEVVIYAPHPISWS